MTETERGYMTLLEFTEKVAYEGGVFDALLVYGLTSDDLDPNDPASAGLRAAWKALEDNKDTLNPLVDAYNTAKRAAGDHRIG